MAANTSPGSILRHPLDSFTDWERVLAHFQHFLRSTQADEFSLLVGKGNSRAGNTFLIERMCKCICFAVGWQTGVLAFAQSFPDFRPILDGVEVALKGCVPRHSLKLYRILCKEYKRCFNEYRASITVSQHVEAKDSSYASDNQITMQVNAELRAELIRVLLELAEECEHPPCLFIDGPVLIVTCGWELLVSVAIKPFSMSDEFGDPSRSHLLVLALVVTYLQAQNLRTKSPLLIEEACIQWFQEHLLSRLPEPYRTPLKHSPILRSFDQAALKALLHVEDEKRNGEMALTDRSYARFLQCLFVNRKNAQGDALSEQTVFHELGHIVHLEALRRLHLETKQRLYHAMTGYYLEHIEEEQQLDLLHQIKPSDKNYTEWLAEIPEQGFRTQVEVLYQALQVEKIQTEAFDRWHGLVARPVNRWRHGQAGLLLELVQDNESTIEGIKMDSEIGFKNREGAYANFLFK